MLRPAALQPRPLAIGFAAMKPPLMVAALLAALGAPAEAQPARPAPRAALPAVETWSLDNGLEVAFAAMPSSPVVSVQLWYRVGAVDDPAGKRGLARVFESLMFAGSGRVRPGDHRRFVEQVGGSASGAVSEDVSAFADTVPSERLDLALELEAERMRGLEIGEDAVQSAIAAVQAQQAQQAQSALFRAYRALTAAAFVQHPYGRAAAAPSEELAAIGVRDVRAFYDAFYQPSNALLVVVGGVEREAARAAIARRFAAIPGPGKPPARRAAGLVEPPQSARRTAELPGADGVAMLGFHIPAASDRDVYAYQLLGQILDGGKSSRLGRLIASERALDVGGQVLVRRDPGLFLVYAGASASGEPEALAGAIGDELAALGKRGPTAAELGRAKKQVAATVLMTAQSASGFGNQLGVAWSLTGKPAEVERDLGDLAAVTAAQIKRAAQALAPDRATVVIGRPLQGGAR
jgi:zinc protease